MNSVIFHSLYDETGLDSLKHGVFYFDKLYVPQDNFWTFHGTRRGAYIQLPPGEVYDDMKVLVDEGVVELIDARQMEGPSPEQIFEFLAQRVSRQMASKTYRLPTTSPLLRSLGVNSSNFSNPANIEVLNQVLGFVATLCLREVALEKKIPCVDHEFIFDLVNLGLESILHDDQVRAALSRAGSHPYKANLLAQRLIALHLPSFEFRSFHDVLELKEKFRDEIGTFQIAMNNFASEIEGTPWEDDFQDRMQIVIANKVNPQIEELRKKLRLSSSSFIAQLWDIARKNVGLTMATTVCFPDWATQAVIVGGAATIAEAFGKERSNRKDAEKNGLSLLMKVR